MKTPGESGGVAAPVAAGQLSYCGLDRAEAARRLARFGPNEFVRIRWWDPLARFVRTAADPMALMLAAAAAAYYALGERTDSYVLLVAIVPVLAIDVLLQARSRAALRKLAGAVAPRATVIREGTEVDLATVAIVPGDALLLKQGDLVHADAVVRASSNLIADESQMSGEAEPVAKSPFGATAQAAETSRVYAGSRILEGNGLVEVTATGANTRYGNLARLAAEAGRRSTPLERKTARIVAWMIVAALTVATILFAVRVLSGVPAGTAFLYAISLAMSAAGEEFLLVLTLFLSLGAYRLGRHGVLVRRLASVETLGSTTVICLDKTGTLTVGEFALETHKTLGAGHDDTALLEAAALACEARPADAMEREILAHCVTDGVDADELHSRWQLVHDFPFDPAGKHMSHVWRGRAGSSTAGAGKIVAKGALEGILEHCDIAPAEAERARIENARMASIGMRVLAVAGREGLASEFTGVRSHDERRLHLFGLLGFRDPLRPAVPAAVAQCYRAGVALKLITGDHALTAHAVAEAAGIAGSESEIITGTQLDALSPSAFDRAVKRCTIFARARPQQKYAIVDALRRAGEAVAMTGDGINDAPALRRADLGVAMGRRGTEIARAAADIVLLDDDFSALAITIREGRTLLESIRHAFLYLIGFKVMLVLVAFSAPLLGLPLLLVPVTLVWLELIVHPVSALAFEGAIPEEDVMARPPTPPWSPLVDRSSAIRAAIAGVLLAGGAMGLFALRIPAGENYARTVAMVVIVAGSLMLVIAEMAGAQPWSHLQAPRSLRFWCVMLTVAASLPAFIYIRPIASLLMLRSIAPADWAIALIVAVAAVGWRALGAPVPRRSNNVRYCTTVAGARGGNR
ncbi:MAG: cation-translocating P-type ATPase [Candidatus Binataceae bacterium]